MRFNIKVKYGLFYVFLQIYFSCIIYSCLMIWKLKIDMTGVLAQSLNTSVTHTIKNSVISPFNCPECNSNALLTKYFSNFKLDRHMWENLCYNVRMEKVNLLMSLNKINITHPTKYLQIIIAYVMECLLVISKS